MEEWKDKVCLITGASSGIGAGIAIEFAKHGCTLALVGRNESNLSKVEDEIKTLGLPKEKILCIIADLLKDKDVASIVKKTIEKFEKINILVNNAGTLHFGDIESLKIEQYDTIMQTNVRSMVQVTQDAIPYLIKNKGNIVNISSIVAIKPNPNLLAYCMSKAAVDQFTRCCSIDLAPKGVRVNSINPGLIPTGIVREAKMSNDETTRFYEESGKAHPRGRLATVEEIAHAVLFIASEKSCFTSGQSLAIEGGRIGPEVL